MTITRLGVCICCCLILLLAGCSPNGTTSATAKPKLVRKLVLDLAGYIGIDGKVVIKPQFLDAKPFSEGLAAVIAKSENGDYVWGYIETSGKMIVKPQFEEAWEFSEGRAVVKAAGEDGKYGYIDGKGRVIAKPQFDKANAFSEGLAAVVVGDKTGYMDRNGNMVIGLRPVSGGDFHNGLALRSGEPHDYYINKRGRVAFSLKASDSGSDFSEGLAWVTVPTGTGSVCGCIDTKGRMVIPPKFDDPLEFKEGRAAVSLRDKYGFVDRRGRMVAKPQFAGQASYSEGLVDVWVGDNSAYRMGYLDRSGRWALKPMYTWAEPFSQGRALVQMKNGVWCFIDKTGKVIVRLEYVPESNSQTGPEDLRFSNGLAVYWTAHYGLVEEEQDGCE